MIRQGSAILREPWARGSELMGDPDPRRAKRKKGKQKNVKLEGFEPPTFGSGIRRAAVAP